MQLEKVLVDQFLHAAAADHARSGVGKGNIAFGIQPVDTLTDGVQNAGLVAFQLTVALLQGPLKADHAGVGTDTSNDFLGLERLGDIIGATQGEAPQLGIHIVQG